MQEFLLNLAQTTLTQIVGVFGIFFVFGFVLAYVQKKTHQLYYRSVGWKGILWTAWIGTPIHELGHVFFAKLFGHKINKISLFEPNAETGNLGHVDHSYKKWSLYQRIGKFFIGAAPMIFGSIFLYLMFRFLLPNGAELFVAVQSDALSVETFFLAIKQTFVSLFAVENAREWSFWLFLYMSFCIASHIAPSKADRKQMWDGFLWLVILLVLLNAILLYFGRDITEYLLALTQYLGLFVAMFTYTLIISLIHLLIVSVLFGGLRKVVK